MTRDLKTNSRRVYRRADSIFSSTRRELKKSYNAALDEIRATLSRLYEQYGVTGEFTKAQMTQFLRNSQLEKSILNIAGSTIDDNKELLSEAMKVSFDEGFFRTGWAIDQAAGVSLGWGQISDDAVRAAVGIGGDVNALKGLISPKELKRHKKIMKDAFTNYDKQTRKWISREIRGGVIKGESVSKVAKRLDGALMKSRNSAEIIARTETLRATGMASQIGYDEARDKGVNVREVWDATLDDRTRPDHAAADGTVKDNESGLFSVPWGEVPGPRRSGIPGQDINCRCEPVGEVEGYAPDVRRQREAGIEPYQTFGTWAERNGIAVNRYGQRYDL